MVTSVHGSLGQHVVLFFERDAFYQRKGIIMEQYLSEYGVGRVNMKQWVISIHPSTLVVMVHVNEEVVILEEMHECGVELTQVKATLMPLVNKDVLFFHIYVSNAWEL